MENVNLNTLKQMVNKAKYIFVYAPSLDAHIQVSKGHLKEIIKCAFANMHIDPNSSYAMAELNDDELFIDSLIS